MKLVISIGSTAFVCPAESAGAIVPALQDSKVYEKPWYGDKEWKPKEEKIEFSFIEDEKLQPIAEPLKKLSEQVEEHSKRWLSELQAHSATKEKLAAAEARVAEFEALATPKAA